MEVSITSTITSSPWGRYFKEKIGTYWSQPEGEALIQAITECGVGNWEMVKLLYFKKRVSFRRNRSRQID